MNSKRDKESLRRHIRSVNMEEAKRIQNGLHYSNADMIRMVTRTFMDTFSSIGRDTPKKIPQQLFLTFTKVTIRSKAAKLWGSLWNKHCGGGLNEAT